MFKLPFTAAALATAALVAPPAAAEGPVRSVRVSLADLNLGTPTGRATSDRRIRRAARTVCAQPMSNMAQMKLRELHCIAAATAGASAQIAVARQALIVAAR